MAIQIKEPYHSTTGPNKISTVPILNPVETEHNSKLNVNVRSREVVAWVLVVLLAIGLLTVNITALLMCKQRQIREGEEIEGN